MNANANGIPFINESMVEERLSYTKAIDIVEDAVAAVSRGDVIQPIRTGIVIAPLGNVLGMMPGYMKAPECLGVKVLTVFPGNCGTATPSHQGIIMLFDPRCGSPIGILDARSITNIRTAATSAVATKWLARSNATRMLIMGYGDLAEAHLAAIKHVRAISDVFVWGRSFDRAAEFASREEKRHSLNVTPVKDIEKISSTVDIICTVTAASHPILYGRQLTPGIHVNLVGSSVPSCTEIDSSGVALARYYVDARAAVLALGGEFIAAIREGLVTEKHIVGELGDIIIGNCEGRRNADEITMFKSLGMISEDLICAKFLLDDLTESELRTNA